MALLPTVAQNAPYTWVIFADTSGNPISTTNPSSVNVAQIGGIAAQMYTSDTVALANVLEIGLGLAQGSSGVNRWYTSGASAIDGNGGAFMPGVTTYAYVGGGLWNTIRTPNIFKPFNAQAVTASSANTPTSIWTPAAGKKFRLMGYWFSISAAAGLVFHDLAAQGGGGVISLPSPLAAAAGIVQSPPNLGNGYLSTAANNQLWIDATAASTLTGFVFGTEE